MKLKLVPVKKTRALFAFAAALCLCLASVATGFAAAGAVPELPPNVSGEAIPAPEAAAEAPAADTAADPAAVPAPAAPVTLQDVIESPGVRIVIDGVPGTYADVPLEIHGRILLPFREILTKLGVANDEEHIIWNEDEQSVTVNYGESVIRLVIGEPVMLLNGEAITFDVSPYFYERNNRTYVPVRAVSELMDKLVMWEDATATVYIRDKANHAETVAALEEVRALGARTKSAANVDAVMEISMSSDDMAIPGADSEGKLTTTADIKTRTEADLDAAVFHITQQMNIMGVAVNTETYSVDGKTYVNMSMPGINDGPGWRELSEIPGAEGMPGLDMDATIEQARLLESQLAERPLDDVAMGIACNKAADGTYTLVGEPVNMGDINSLISSMLQNMNLEGVSVEMEIEQLMFADTLDENFESTKSSVVMTCSVVMTQTGANGNSADINMDISMDANYTYDEVPEDFAITLPDEVQALG